MEYVNLEYPISSSRNYFDSSIVSSLIIKIITKEYKRWKRSLGELEEIIEKRLQEGIERRLQECINNIYNIFIYFITARI